MPNKFEVEIRMQDNQVSNFLKRQIMISFNFLKTENVIVLCLKMFN